MKFKFEIGQRVQDSVTKFEGQITGRAEYDTGYRSYQVQSLSKTGEILTEWLQEERVEPVA